jgi:putative ABC transport system ATP-binding protein
MSLVSIKNLTKRFPIGGGEFTALRDISLTFEPGEFCGLVGPSGSGKTTLLNIIGSLDSPSDGQVTVMDRDVGQLKHADAAELRKAKMGFIFQTYNLLPVYTVFENVEFPLLLLKIEKAQRTRMVNEALAWMHLEDKRGSRPAQLSGGQCQRVAIARAMVKRPPLVLADEPTANLDAENSRHILDLMEKLNHDLGTTFIFATHDDKVIGRLRRRIVLNDGAVTKDEKQ